MESLYAAVADADAAHAPGIPRPDEKKRKFGWLCGPIGGGVEPRRKQIADQVQTLAYDEVPYVPWGQYTQPTAYRKNVKGVLTFPASLYWNVAVEA